MAEQRFCKPQVGGSIPLASSTKSIHYVYEMPLASHETFLGNISTQTSAETLFLTAPGITLFPLSRGSSRKNSNRLWVESNAEVTVC